MRDDSTAPAGQASIGGGGGGAKYSRANNSHSNQHARRAPPKGGCLATRPSATKMVCTENKLRPAALLRSVQRMTAPAGAAKAEPVPTRTVLSHADMVAAATKDDGPLSIGGWVPPTNFAVPAARGAAALQSAAEADQDDNDGGEDDGLVPRHAGHNAEDQAEEVRGEQAGEAAQEGGGLVGYGSDSDSDSGSEAPAERDRPVSFF